jgi:hypothetical protein
MRAQEDGYFDREVVPVTLPDRSAAPCTGHPRLEDGAAPRHARLRSREKQRD